MTWSAPTMEPAEQRPWPRYAELALGLWLIISAFSWSHPAQTATNTWVFGLIIIVASLSTLRTVPAYWMVRAAAALLFITSLPAARFSTATALNNVLVAIAIVVVSFVPAATAMRRSRA